MLGSIACGRADGPFCHARTSRTARRSSPRRWATRRGCLLPAAREGCGRRAEATLTASVDPALFVAKAQIALSAKRPADISDQARQGAGRDGHRRLQGEAVGGDERLKVGLKQGQVHRVRGRSLDDCHVPPAALSEGGPEVDYRGHTCYVRFRRDDVRQEAEGPRQGTDGPERKTGPVRPWSSCARGRCHRQCSGCERGSICRPSRSLRRRVL